MMFSVGENLRNRHILLIGMLIDSSSHIHVWLRKFQFQGFILQKQEHMRAYGKI